MAENKSKTAQKPVVKLKPKRERRLRDGHLWVFPWDVGEVYGDPGPGEIVDVVDGRGRFLARGYYNERSQLLVRVLTNRDEVIDREFLKARIQRAWDYRCRILEDTGMCRVVFGEGDLLPGLVVDRYGDFFVIQTPALGMDRMKEDVVSVLVELFQPTCIYERNDGTGRTLEGLEPVAGVLYGQVPEHLGISWQGLNLTVDVQRGQKTGLFLDQRFNHAAVAELCKGARVLDAFCHTGGFGLHAARGGAKSVLGVDVSADSLAQAAEASRANGLDSVTTWREGNVFDVLRELPPEFDVIVLDPPAFAHSKSAVNGAIRGYREINLRALKLLEPGGILVTCSCSFHMVRDLFLSVIQEAARDAKRRIRILEERSQAPDHPILVGHPETGYLKCFILEVI